MSNNYSGFINMNKDYDYASCQLHELCVNVYVFFSIRIDKAKVTLAIESNYNLKLNLFMRLSWWLWPVQAKFNGRFSKPSFTRTHITCIRANKIEENSNIYWGYFRRRKNITQKKTQKNCENRWRKNGINKSCLRAKANIVAAITNFLWVCVCVCVYVCRIVRRDQ